MFGWHSIFCFLDFGVTISATVDAKTLADWINMVARTADAMEKRLTGLDEL